MTAAGVRTEASVFSNIPFLPPSTTTFNFGPILNMVKILNHFSRTLLATLKVLATLNVADIFLANLVLISIRCGWKVNLCQPPAIIPASSPRKLTNTDPPASGQRRNLSEESCSLGKTCRQTFYIIYGGR